MSRKRITAKTLEAADASFGQSANNYWRTRAKDAIQGALDDVSKELWSEAQRITDSDAKQLGVEPADYDGPDAAPVVEVEAEVEVIPVVPEEVVGDPEEAEEAEETEETEAEDAEGSEEEIEEEVRMGMVFEPRRKEASENIVFEPRKKEAGAPVDASAIGKENWFQVQETFPQYTKQKKLTMLAVAPTSRNSEAVVAITDTLDEIASVLEENDSNEAATQLDVISELLTASVQECKKISNAKRDLK